MRIGRFIAVLALVACAAAPADAAGPKTRYERVFAQEQALRLKSRRPSPLSQIRKVVAAYEVVARRYPTSGYADNALLQGAELSLTAHRLYGSEMDRDVAARMLEWMIAQYPHSSLQTKARQLLKRARPRPPLQVASAKPPASPLASRETAESTAVPPAAATVSLARGAEPVVRATERGGRSSSVTLKQVTRTTLADLVRVTLEFDGEVAYRQERLDGPPRLYFDLERTQAAPGLQDAGFSYEDETVRHIRLGRPRQDMTRLVIDLAGVERYSVFALYNPYRLTIDLTRKPRPLAPLVARRVDPVAKIAPRLKSAVVPKDLGIVARIPPRPLPHPLADTPRVTSRPVSAQMAALMRVRPLRASRRGMPMSVAAALSPASVSVTAQVASLFVPPPLAASRRGLALNASATRAPKPVPLAARVRADDEAARREAAARARAEEEAARREAETARRDAAVRAESPATNGPGGTVVAGALAGAAAARMTPPPPLPNRPSAPPTLPAPTPPSTNAAGGFSLARQLGLGVARIVIDPGHGGHDPGALGSKVNESSVVLDVALRLEKLLQNEPGFEVLMTRRTDVFIPLEERTAFANRHQADLFLSIHANSSRNRQAHGVETYFLNFASNPEAEAVAARENAGAAHTMNHLPEIVRAIALNNKLDESRDFARMVQESMVGRLKTQNASIRDLGVKQAPFVVLIGAGMPSVLAEIAFVSHQQEGNLLKTGAYRQRIAEALFDAVKAYQRSLKNIGTVAGMP